VPWVAPGAPADVARAAGSTCGREWGPAVKLGNLPGNLPEVSGFVSSARYPGVAWMIRDSNNPESLYSFELDGDQPRWNEFPVLGVGDNVDWEDIAYTVGSDGRGRVWILENGIETGPKKLYEIIEPDPGVARSVPVEHTYRFEYPGSNLNTEAMFSLGGRLVVVAKTLPNRVYQLPSPLSPSGTNRLSAAGSLDVHSWVTAVQVSGDEGLVMGLTTQDEVTIIESQGPGDVRAFSDESVFIRSMPETQREGGDFFPYDSCDIVLVSEDATVWRLPNVGAVQPVQPIEPLGDPDPTSEPVAPPAPAAPEAPPAVRHPAGASPGGYWMVASDGTVYAFGGAVDHGGASRPGSAAAVDLEATPTSAGYWVVDTAGQVHAFGDATDLGSVEPGALAAGETVTSLSRTPSGGGYWIFTNRGRVLPFGDARPFGDLTGLRLNGPVLDSVATPSGGGYYMVASDGGVFTFGDARFHGSMGGTRLNAPVRSLVPDPDGDGYWLVASDGGVFAFDAPFRGSLAGIRLNRPVVGMVAFHNGYLMLGSDGGAFNFSDGLFQGSLGDRPPAAPIVSVAVVR
ncbi:MAG: hypothetical protein ACRD0O_17435, partial [Acidimicrobiia bacterium]